MVIVLSNFSNQEEIKTAQALGVEAYLLKSQNNSEAILKVVQDKLFKGETPPNYEIVDFSKPLN